MVDTSGCGVSHAGVEAVVFNDRSDIVFTARIGQMIEEKSASHSEPDWPQSATQKLCTFCRFGVENHVHRLRTSLVGVLFAAVGIDLVNVIGHSVGDEESRAVDDFFAILRLDATGLTSSTSSVVSRPS